MRKTRFASLAASAALASATILGGAGIANASLDAGSLSSDPAPVAGETDSVTGGGAEVVATSYNNCEVSFEFTAPEDPAENKWNWVVDYRVDQEEPSIPKYENDNADDGELIDHLSVFRPVVASKQGVVDSLNKHENGYDVDLLKNTVNLNDVVEPNEDGEHTVTFKFYRGSADWDNTETNLGEVTVTGCDTLEDEDDGGLLGSVVGSVDVFGSLENFS